MIFDLISFSNNILSHYYSIGIIGLILIFALAIDMIFGEFPEKVHPVVIIGKFIGYFEKYFIKIKNKLSGIYLTMSVTFLSFSIAIIFFLISTINFFIFIIASTLILSSLFSLKLLLSSANNVGKDLSIDLKRAQRSVSFLVSRKTDTLSEKLITSAVIETLTENITDSCISVFFYYLISGVFVLILILLLNDFFSLNNILIIFINKNIFYIICTFSIIVTIFYRIINTLDAMVAYKNDKYLLIGWFPAKLDDLLNYIPSRFSGLMVVISAFLLNLNWKNSYFILKRDSRNCSSPNSGFTMSAAAGALDIQLKKEGAYIIGDKNQELTIDHIYKAIKLTKVSIFNSIIVLIGIFNLTLYLLFVIYPYF
ncbi:MAG: cobalamin biosynthesis protein [Methanobacteriaceae archaeon]|jgi:adenosylcobinamide-phosphate synthase|nr:cobalamin biosynthesis protein [Candidatus Methanorudis spinitermitis]